MQSGALRGQAFLVAALPFLTVAYFFAWYRSFPYLAAGVLVAGPFLFAFLKWDRVGRWQAGTALGWTVALILPAWGAWQWLNLGDIIDIDQACYSQAIHNLGKGELDFHIFGRHLFGIHSQYTLVAWIPVQWVFGELGLKVGKGLCLLATAWILTRGLQADRETRAWAAAAFLLSPGIASQFFYGFHPEFLGAPLLALALWAYRERNLGAFLALTFLLAYTKESFTMAIGGILLLALIERRSWRWWLLPGLLCCVQMAFYWFVVVPRFAPAGNHLSFYFPTLGQIPALWVRAKTLAYFAHILLPFLPLLLAFPKRYLVLPLPLLVFYASFPDPFFMSLWGNYAFALSILCCAGLILGGESETAAAEGPEAASNPALRPLGRLLMATTACCLLCYPLYREVLSLPHGKLARGREVDRLRKMVPESASVLIHGNFVTRFAGRKDFNVLGGWQPKPPEAYDYVVIDAEWTKFWMPDIEEVRRTARALGESPAWITLYARNDLYLFRQDRP